MGRIVRSCGEPVPASGYDGWGGHVHAAVAACSVLPGVAVFFRAVHLRVIAHEMLQLTCKGGGQWSSSGLPCQSRGAFV